MQRKLTHRFLKAFPFTALLWTLSVPAEGDGSPRPHPVQQVPVPAMPGRKAEPPKPKPVDPHFRIIVEKGDTLKSISNAYVVSEEDLCRVNNLKPEDTIREGDILIIPSTPW